MINTRLKLILTPESSSWGNFTISGYGKLKCTINIEVCVCEKEKGGAGGGRCL